MIIRSVLTVTSREYSDVIHHDGWLLVVNALQTDAVT